MSYKSNDTILSGLNVIKGCEDSLMRLGTDYFNLYRIYSYGPETPLEETLRAIDHLVQS